MKRLYATGVDWLLSLPVRQGIDKGGNLVLKCLFLIQNPEVHFL